MIFTVLFYIFVAVTVIQIIYYFYFSVFAFEKNKTQLKSNEIPVSIIILVKNEAENLTNYIQTILQQNYSNFEIVLINNASSDSTLDIIEELQKQHLNIKLVNVENTEAFWGNKKYALTLGIKAASHEHLLFTETNSIPLSKNWIREMTLNFSKEKTIVIGHKKLKSKKHSFSNLLFRFDNFINTIQSFSYAKTGNAFTANSSNIGYTKNDFFKVNGFINHLNIFIGESDLFLKDASTNKNTVIAISNASFVESSGIYSFKKWFSKKRKQSIVASLYKFKHKFFLRLFIISKILFYPLAIYLAILNWKIITPIIFVYFLIQYIIIGKSAYKLQEKQILFFLPILDICLVLLQITIFISTRISKPTHWK